MPETYTVCDLCEPVVARHDLSRHGRGERTAVLDRLGTIGPLVFTGQTIAPAAVLCDVCGGILVSGGALAERK